MSTLPFEPPFHRTLRRSTPLFSILILLLPGCEYQPSPSEVPPGSASVPTNQPAVASENSQMNSRSIRFATFNTALNRPSALALAAELESGNCNPAHQIAEIVQRVRPDVLLLNEVDYDADNRAADAFQQKYLGVPHGDAAPIAYPFRFLTGVNTGQPTGVDLNRDGESDGPEDAFGYGKFPGQYGMIVLSQFPIDQSAVRTFQNFLWKDMPNAQLPTLDGEPYYKDAQRAILRLASKSLWDVPIQIPIQIDRHNQTKTVHFIVSHPTPPVFDGEEDRNGKRNHDEIRLLADYVDPIRSAYICDDNGNPGGLPNGAHFVLAGDLNADPLDGDSTGSPMELLLNHDRIDGSLTPKSKGGLAAGKTGGANAKQKGDPAADTGNFGSRVGNLRIDYVLPSKTLRTVDSGVYWPAPETPGHDLVDASDHRLVWINVEL